MSMVKSFVTAIGAHLRTLLSGISALMRLIGIVAVCLVSREGTIRTRLIARLTAPAGLRLGFDVLRAFVPNLALRRKVIVAYDNVGTAVVARYQDVKDVLHRDRDFEVVYAPRMMRITDGENFFLGMPDSARYTRDVSNMRLAVRRDDVTALVEPFAIRRASEIVKQAAGRIDVPQDLSLQVPAALLGTYFGTPGPSVRELIEWTTLMFWYLFIDLAADIELEKRALDAAARCRSYLDELIQQRKRQPTDADDVLNRCLIMQRAGLPGMDDLGIRNNLIGLIIGAVPTVSKAAVNALDQLLDRPDWLSSAQTAARSGDDALLAAHVFEALRFNPINPVIFRRAARAVTIAKNTLRSLDVSRGTMVLASNLSAMFDPMNIAAPNSFRTDRQQDNYILWGDGLHTCFGAHINQVLVPSILKPLLTQNKLRRAAGELGSLDCKDTPFPVHMWLEFDPT